MLTPSRKYSILEEERIRQYAAEFSLRSQLRLHEFLVPDKEITYIIGADPPAKAMKRLYCSEGSATLAEMVRPYTFIQPAGANPVDVVINVNTKYQ